MLACDLPFLDAATLEHLMRAARSGAHGDRLSVQPRRPARTAVRDLRAARAARRFSRTSRRARHCPRKFLINADAKLLEQPNPRALDNINTPEEYGAASGSS